MRAAFAAWLLKPLGNFFQHLVLIREFTRLQLRIGQFSVQRKLKTSSAIGDQIEGADFSAEFSENFTRQTGGLGCVVSLGTKFKFDFHCGSPVEIISFSFL